MKLNMAAKKRREAYIFILPGFNLWLSFDLQSDFKF